MDVLIVKLDGDVIHDLDIEGDSDALGSAVRLCKQAVIVATAATEAFPIVREGKTRNEDDIERGDFDDRAVRLRLPDIHLAAMQILHAANLPCPKSLMFDLEEAGAHTLRMQGRQQMRHQIRFIFQAAKEGYGDTRWPGGSEVCEMGGNMYTRVTARGFIHRTQAFAHGLAQRGFVVHAFDEADRDVRAPFRAVRVSATVRPRV